jgi:drug/metabolite transporter, DME family
MSSDSSRDVWIGRFQIALAGILWSTSGFFAKAPWFDAWPEDARGLLLAFFRALFAIPVLLPLIRKITWQWQMLPMMVCFAIMVWSFMSAVVNGPAANAIWLQYLCPVWVLLVSVLVFRESITGLDRLMFAFCISGVGFILACEMVHGGNLQATLLGILSGVGFAAVVMFIRSLNQADPAWLIVLNHSATVILLAPWAWQEHRLIGVNSYIALAFFGVFQMSVAYILFARGLRTTASHEAAILSLIEPILVPVWVYVAWHHHATYVSPPWWTWVGASLITLGMVTRYLPPVIASCRPSPKAVRQED